MNKFCLTTKIVISLFFIGNYIYCQNSNHSEIAIFKWFDNLTYPKNSDLVNGAFHSEKYGAKKGQDQYYLTPDFLLGNLIYDDQPYYDVNLSYDLYSDDLILGFRQNDLLLPITLVKDKVTSFNIKDKTFLKLSETKEITDGFYELILNTDDLKLYKKHKKKLHKIVREQAVVYSFTDRNYYLIYYKNSYSRIGSKLDVLKLFPEQKKSIKTFYNKHSFSLENNKDKFFKQLFQEMKI